jgi:hypothetical protein
MVYCTVSSIAERGAALAVNAFIPPQAQSWFWEVGALCAWRCLERIFKWRKIGWYWLVAR